jgi:hypothetical protein
MSDEDVLMAIRPAILGLIGEDALAFALDIDSLDDAVAEQVQESSE